MRQWLLPCITLSLLCIVALVVYFGQNHLETINAEQGENADVKNQQWEERVQKKKEEEINKWKPDGSPRSFIDDVRYYRALKRTVRISTLGSSVTDGTGSSDRSKNWSSQLTMHLREIDGFANVILNNNGFGGYSTRRILAEEKVDDIIAQKPDIVLFETCIINDHGGVNGATQIEETNNNIAEIVGNLQKGLPDAKIILLSSNPLAVQADVSNSLGLKIEDYAQQTKEFILSNGWSYIDVYAGFRERNADMESLTVDGIHPNDEGYTIWFEIMKEEFEKVQ